MAKNENGFDAVRMMRSLRDALGEQLRGMTLEEQREYLRNRLRSPTARRSSATPVTTLARRVMTTGRAPNMNSGDPRAEPRSVNG